MESILYTAEVMVRRIGAVVFGYVVIAALIHLWDRVFEAAIPGFAAMTIKPQSYFAISLVTDAVSCAAGGWICAVIGRTKSHFQALALIVLAESIAAVSAATLWNIVPHYFSIAELILTPLAIWIGCTMGRKQSTTVAAAI